MYTKKEMEKKIGCKIFFNDAPLNRPADTQEVVGRIVGIRGDSATLRYEVEWEDEFPPTTVAPDSVGIIRLEKPHPLSEILEFLQARDLEVIYDSQAKALNDQWVFTFLSDHETVHICPLTEDTETVEIKRCTDEQNS